MNPRFYCPNKTLKILMFSALLIMLAPYISVAQNGPCIVTDGSDNPTDPDDNTLRWAVNKANAGECTLVVGSNTFQVIEIDNDAAPTITLLDTLPQINSSDTLAFLGNSSTITNDDSIETRCMEILSESEPVEIFNVIFDGCGGNVEAGGAIFNSGHLSIFDSEFNNNSTGNEDTDPNDNHGGGAIFNQGLLKVDQSNLTFNNSGINGGGAIKNIASNAGEGEYDVLLSGFGFITNNYTDGSGGALININGKVLINSYNISQNQSSDNGGAVSNLNGQIIFPQSSVNRNHSTNKGGAIYNEGSESLIKFREGSSLIQQNTSNYGGGIYNNSGRIEILTNANIANNDAFSSGGGIYSDGGTVIGNISMSNNTAINNGGGLYIKNTTVENIEPVFIRWNRALNGNGGGIYQEGGTISLNCITFSDNFSANSGGGIQITAGLLDINSSFFERNTATWNGGAIHSTDTNGSTIINLLNVGIFDNSSPGGTIFPGRGGGIAVNQEEDGTTVNIAFTTFKDNSSSDETGGGIDNTDGMVNLKNSILDNNSDMNCFNDAFINDNGGNISSDNTCTVENEQFNVDPIISFPSFGTCVPAMIPDGDSRAVNLIEIDDCTDNEGNSVEVDSRDMQRPSPFSDKCDAGYIEFQITGSISIKKEVISVEADNEVFQFTGTGFPSDICAELDGNFTLQNNESITCTGLPANQPYSISESVPEGYHLGITCTGISDVTILDNQVDIFLLENRSVSCTFENINLMGPQGPSGPSGPAGPPGDDGEPGEPGDNVLINTSEEPPGENCPNGGTRIEIGVDSNENGILDPEEVEEVIYVCDGAPGSSGCSIINNATNSSSFAANIFLFLLIIGIASLRRHIRDIR